MDRSSARSDYRNKVRPLNLRGLRCGTLIPDDPLIDYKFARDPKSNSSTRDRWPSADWSANDAGTVRQTVKPKLSVNAAPSRGTMGKRSEAQSKPGTPGSSKKPGEFDLPAFGSFTDREPSTNLPTGFLSTSKALMLVPPVRKMTYFSVSSPPMPEPSNEGLFHYQWHGDQELPRGPRTLDNTSVRKDLMRQSQLQKLSFNFHNNKGWMNVHINQ
ncbi:hypothetical protein RvY_10744 [Ramazzottius varieornatus]|uniref:Uncharacterized protein n=1 Tax=Ramazzottius varieornatus TaxID=947166 RepID=A0A1D1VDR4_RAMVA|nr:hypothetical protein RvY_10744 [Ramazzottius varieornatus]